MQFLTLPHTRKWYRVEHTFPVVSDRETYDAWAATGKKTMADRAAEEAARLLRNNPPVLPDKAVVQEMQRIMLAEARKAGLKKLPV